MAAMAQISHCTGVSRVPESMGRSWVAHDSNICEVEDEQEIRRVGDFACLSAETQGRKDAEDFHCGQRQVPLRVRVDFCA